MSEIIKAVNIQKKFIEGPLRINVINGLSITVNTGDFICVKGVSGSGKTTLLFLLSTLSAPTEGAIFFKGKPVKEARNVHELRNQNIGFVFQQFYLIQELTVLENVMLPYYIKTKNKKEALDKALLLLERFNLEDRKDFSPNLISGGEKQRAAIARALINDPDIIFADEPTGNLDRANADNLIDIFKELNAKGKTIVIVTHDENIAKKSLIVYNLKDGVLKGAGS